MRVGAHEVADRREARGAQPLLRDRADAPDPPHRQRREEAHDVAGRHLEQPVRLRDVAGDLRDHLHRRDPDRDGELGLVAHGAAQRVADRARGSEQALGAGEIEERLVEREPLHDGREAREDREDPPRLRRTECTPNARAS